MSSIPVEVGVNDPVELLLEGEVDVDEARGAVEAGLGAVQEDAVRDFV